MKVRANTVSYELANHAKAVGFNVFLHGSADISNGVAHARLIDAAIKRCFSHREQFLQLRRDIFAYRNGVSGIAVITIWSSRFSEGMPCTISSFTEVQSTQG